MSVVIDRSARPEPQIGAFSAAPDPEAKSTLDLAPAEIAPSLSQPNGFGMIGDASSLDPPSHQKAVSLQFPAQLAAKLDARAALDMDNPELGSKAMEASKAFGRKAAELGKNVGHKGGSLAKEIGIHSKRTAEMLKSGREFAARQADKLSAAFKKGEALRATKEGWRGISSAIAVGGGSRRRARRLGQWSMRFKSSSFEVI